MLLRAEVSGTACAMPVFQDIGSAGLAVVVTFSAGSLAARQGWKELHALGTTIERHGGGTSRAILAGKGTRCTTTTPLHSWYTTGKAHCIEGPNVGARESHSIWSFCHDFYQHLPRVMLFVQDDPSIFAIRRELTVRGVSGWAEALEASFAARSRRVADFREPWVPAACACNPVREGFTAATYGGYRPLHWWMRTFLAPFANGSNPLPDRIAWPTTAQFALSRKAVLLRSRRFLRYQVRLSEVPAPLKALVPRLPQMSDSIHLRNAKWANFGPLVVDLGDAPARGAGHADVRPGINGMDAAQLYERSWFQAFDPALPEVSAPPHPECFDSLAASPMRCAGAACPYQAPGAPFASGGCAATDRSGRTKAPPKWPYALQPERRCLGTGCLVGPEPVSSAWSLAASATA